MCPVLERLCLWPFALCAAFPHSLGGRYPTDYYGQCAPPVPDTAQASLLKKGGQGGSPVAVWLLGWGRVGFQTRSP